MSNTVSLTATKREALGSAASRRLRKQGFVPAVIYSHGEENVHFQVSLEQFKKIEHHAGLVSIDIEGEGKRNAIVKEIQYKAISSQPLAIDFLGVKAGEKVTVIVPIEAKGDPEGLREGGQLEQVIHELEIEVAPADIPEVLVVDVSALKLDDTLTIAEIALPASAKALHDQTQIVFQVRLPHVVEEPAETEPAPAEGDAAAAAAAPAADAK